MECQWEPALTQDENVACDKGNCWFHYKCVDLKGTESFFYQRKIQPDSVLLAERKERVVYKEKR